MAAEPVQSSSKRRRTAAGTPPQVVRTPSLGVVEGGAAGGGARLLAGLGGESVDLTHAVTGAVAHALWQLRGGEDIANWVDAERLVEQFLRSRDATGGDVAEVVVPPRRASARR